MAKRRILVVDDERDLVEMIQLRLEAQGYEVSQAYDGEEGLEKAKREKPDLVLLDLMLPKMDGYKVCGLLKHDTRFAKIPIMIFTARAQAEDEKLGLECGADAYLIKPFVAQTLLAKIQELIGKKSEV